MIEEPKKKKKEEEEEEGKMSYGFIYVCIFFLIPVFMWIYLFLIFDYFPCGILFGVRSKIDIHLITCGHG